MLKYSKNIEISAHYTDMYSRLFIKTLCELFNDLANEQTLSLGVDVDTFNTQGITWMLYQLHIKINRLPLKGECVIAETWPAGLDRFFALRDFHIVSSEGEELAKLTSKWMVIDLERRRPVRLPKSVISIYEAHCADIAPSLEFELNAKGVDFDITDERQFIASYDNIDFNLHVTQASYVGWVTNSLPYEFLKEHELEEIEIIYEHEILPDSVVISGYYMEHSGENYVVYHCVMNEDKTLNHCVARSVWIKNR